VYHRQTTVAAVDRVFHAYLRNGEKTVFLYAKEIIIQLYIKTFTSRYIL